MNQQQHLSLEQEFELRVFVEQVQQFSQEEARDYLVGLYRNTMVRENLYRDILKEAWGIGKDLKDVLDSEQL